MIITGGRGNEFDVIQHDYDGVATVLPSPNIGRQVHACGHYVDSNGDEVKF